MTRSATSRPLIWISKQMDTALARADLLRSGCPAQLQGTEPRRAWHHVRRRCAPARQLQRQPEALRVGGHVLDAGRPDVPRLALLVCLPAADGDEHPVAVGHVGTSAQRSPLTSLPPHPAHEEEPRDHRVEAAALEGDLLGLAAGAAPARLMSGGEDGSEVRRPERAAPGPGRYRRRSAGSRRGRSFVRRPPGSRGRRGGLGTTTAATAV